MTENTIEAQNPTGNQPPRKQKHGFQPGHKLAKGRKKGLPAVRYNKEDVGGIKAAIPFRREFKFSNLDRILQEILVDELRHQKRCEEMCKHFYARIKESELLQDSEVSTTYDTDVKALTAFSDQFGKFKPITLKVVDSYIKLLRDVGIKTKQEMASDDLIDDLLKDNN
jgi:hypothetical protein